MVQLPDVNVLIALAWPNHVHHEAALDWFSSESSRGWATCPLTQSGFVRVSSNRRALPEAKSPHEAILLLDQILTLPGHVFWVDDVSVADRALIERDRLVGHRQVTDAHLLGLAIRRGGRLATFDRGVADVVPPGHETDRLLRLLG